MVSHEWDLVVVGAGGAGLSAAVAAADDGARVLVFESEGDIGGSTRLSAGMFTAGGTSVQAALGVQDTWEKYFQHYMDLNEWRLRPGLIRSFCQRSTETFEWLLSIGLEVPPQRSTNAHMPGLTRAGVEDVWRGHVPAGEGFGLIETLDRARRERRIDVVLHSRVQRLCVRNGAVAGVVVDDTEVPAPSVLVASGGLTRDPQLLARHFPEALRAGDSMFIVSAPGSRGDHIRFGEQVDSALGGDRWGLILVTAYFQTVHHWQAGFAPKSRVLVNAAGHRFMDEDASYAVASGIVDDNGGQVWMIFDEAARVALPAGFVNWTPRNVLAEVEAGRTYRADDLALLAKLIDVPAEALTATLRRWNETLPLGSDPDFLRDETLRAKGVVDPPNAIVQPPFYAVRTLPAEVATSHTGLLIDEKARVIDSIGRVVPGLYAAGESCGGVLGHRYVGGGNAIANAIVNGRTAGLDAAARR